MKRMDQWLVDLKLVPSRTKAKELLQRGCIQVQSQGEWLSVHSPAQKWGALTHDQVKITDSDLLKYVSRSGIKLEGALREAAVTPRGWLCFDVGQSTGGFTDCLLQAGALKVVGVDVGKNQLAESLRVHPKVEFFEGINARDAESSPIFRKYFNQVDLLVMDVSFISITKVLKSVLPVVKPDGHVLILIKPQFELGASALNKNGVVKDTEELKVLKEKMFQHFDSIGLQQIDLFNSQLAGRDGNQEFFLHAKK